MVYARSRPAIGQAGAAGVGGKPDMFRSFAVALALLLAAAAVVFVVVDEAARTGRRVLPAVPGLESFAFGADAADNVPAADGTQPDFVADPATADLFLRTLGAFLIISTIMGSIILDQSARILEIPRRSLLRSTTAMLLASVAFLCSVVLAWGLSVRMEGLVDASLFSIAVFLVIAVAVAFLAVLSVMKYTYHTTTGKALFLLVSYRFAFAFSVVTTILAAWLSLSGWLADGLEAVVQLI